jgi:hypothetical protein
MSSRISLASLMALIGVLAADLAAIRAGFALFGWGFALMTWAPPISAIVGPNLAITPFINDLVGRLHPIPELPSAPALSLAAEPGLGRPLRMLESKINEGDINQILFEFESAKARAMAEGGLPAEDATVLDEFARSVKDYRTLLSTNIRKGQNSRQIIDASLSLLAGLIGAGLGVLLSRGAEAEINLYQIHQEPRGVGHAHPPTVGGTHPVARG